MTVIMLLLMRINPRIAVAFVVGLTMAGGAYMLSKNSESKEASNQLIVSAENPVRQFISVADEDRDGLPDWQNSLSIHTINLDEEQEDTRTSSLAVELATLTTATEASPDSILASIGGELAFEALDNEYTPLDIKIIEDNSQASLRSYGNKVADIALKNAPPAGTEDELTVLNRALVRNDPDILNNLSPTILSYERMIGEMLVMSVPSSMVREHLSLLNVYQAILNDIKGFQGVFEDALPAMMRFRRYQADVEALYVALNLVYLRLHNEGIVWAPTDKASQFITIE